MKLIYNAILSVVIILLSACSHAVYKSNPNGSIHAESAKYVTNVYFFIKKN